MGTCRLVIEPEPQSGVRNMAVDEALLEAALERGECTVRWYRWQAATVSLGYFQDASAATAIPDFVGLPVVRRLTGGGAILHHHEWTYSCSVPADHPFAAAPLRIYELVHERVIAALIEQGVKSPALRGTSPAGEDAAFLCFGRGDPRDVVLNGHKIVGSAQRRRRGAVLQHGSLLFRRSDYAPQFPGILDLVPGATLGGEFISGMADSVGRLFGTPSKSEIYASMIADRIGELVPRYQSLDWGRRHSSND